MSIVVALLLSVGCSEAATIFNENPDTMKIWIENEEMIFDNQSGSIYVDEKGVIHIPLLEIANVINAEVFWNKEMDIVRVVKDKKELKLPIGESYFIENDNKHNLLSPIIKVNSKLYAPLKPLVESYGYLVSLENEGKDVRIEKNASYREFEISFSCNDSTGHEQRKELYMAVPQEWNDFDNIYNIKNMTFFPEEPEILIDSNNNKIAKWTNIDLESTYGMKFTAWVRESVSNNINVQMIKSYDVESLLYNQYTEASENIESDHQTIIELANKIVGDEENPYYQARLIGQWIDSNIEASGIGKDSALETIKLGKGHCASHSSLFAALCRANGIPTRIVSGMHTFGVQDNKLHNGTFQLETLGTHLWNEYYLEGVGWIQVDTTRRGYEGIYEERVILSKGDVYIADKTYHFFHLPMIENPNWWLLQTGEKEFGFTLTISDVK